MNKIIINYAGGYRQVSKYLTLKHDANFALILDALVYIHNENLSNLEKVGDKFAVKIANSFLSRNTGLGISIIKRNVVLIEKIGLITAVKKGQGNTRHYVININCINTYIAALKPKFEIWYEKSIVSSKKDKARSEAADKLKVDKSLLDFKKSMAKLKEDSIITKVGLVENRPTQLVKTDQHNGMIPTVVDRAKERDIKTTTKETSVVVNLFTQKDAAGVYYIYKFEDFEKKVYKQDYEDFIKSFTDEGLKQKIEEIEEIVNSRDLISGYDFEDNPPPKKKRVISADEIMIHIYNEIRSLEDKLKRKKDKEFKTTKEPAVKEVADSNWTKLEAAYKALPNFENQGKFINSKEDKANFFNLSEYQQQNVVEKVESMKDATTTASRPAIYINEATEGKLKSVKYEHKRLLISI